MHRVEQHSPALPQASPSTLQLPPGMVAHTLPVHTPVQHSPAAVQAEPVATQDAVPHWPEAQLLLQQSLSRVHAPPGSRQKVEEVQTEPAHTPPQQGSVALQESPAPTHWPPSGSWPLPPPVPPPVVPPPSGPPSPVPTGTPHRHPETRRNDAARVRIRLVMEISGERPLRIRGGDLPTRIFVAAPYLRWGGDQRGCVPVRHWFPLFVFIVVASCQNQACPSYAGENCNPRSFDCPPTYTCAMAEICTRACEQTSDCWVKVTDGCRFVCLPGQRLSDGGVCTEQSDDGFCPETRTLECVGGYCQRGECADGGCDYDLYGPSDFKGNRDQGPLQ